MADRYQDRPFPAVDRGGNQAPSKGESDPLAELARLIGQTDPFANLGRPNPPAQPRSERAPLHPPRSQPAPEPDDPFASLGRANQPVQPRAREREPFHQPQPDPALEPDDRPASPPSWMQRVAAKEPPQDLDAAVHPVQRYGAAHTGPEYDESPLFLSGADQHEPADPQRYDDALYGQLPSRAADLPQDAGYDDPYDYQDEYEAGEDEQAPKPRRGGMITVAVVLALAVVGTGAAFAYRTYVGSPRSGEPPIIKADTGPNKVLPPTQSGDSSGKLIQDRLTAGGAEKLVSREEQPVDLKDGRSGPRVVFPPLNQNANPPSSASVAPGNRPPAIAGNAPNGTLGDEPRKIRTFTVRGDQPDAAAAPAAKSAPTARSIAPTAAAPVRPSPAAANANASSANVPLSLTPQASAPVVAPAASSGGGGGGGSMVQLSSQRNEADALASFKALQSKFPAALGSRAPLIKRADLGEKGIYYRALVGPFGSPDEASQFCGNLKTAGGQCVVQRN